MKKIDYIYRDDLSEHESHKPLIDKINELVYVANSLIIPITPISEESKIIRSELDNGSILIRPKTKSINPTPISSKGRRIFLKECILFHNYQEIKNTSKWSYQQCNKCGKRRIIEINFNGYQPIDNEFLKRG